MQLLGEDPSKIGPRRLLFDHNLTQQDQLRYRDHLRVQREAKEE